MPIAACQVSGVPTASITASAAATRVGEAAHFRHPVGAIGGNNEFGRAHALGALELRRAPSHGNHAGAAQVRQSDEHQPDRTQADHRDRIPFANPGFLNAAHHAGQWLDHRRVAVSDSIGDLMGVASHNRAGDPNIFGVSAVVEQKVFAKVLLLPLAGITVSAGRRIGRDDPLPHLEISHFRTDRYNVTRQLVPQHRRRSDHACMVTAPEHL